MKHSFIFILLLLILYSCDKECPSSNSNCIDYTLIPNKNVKNSKDLEKYLLKEDSTYFINGDTLFASATKLVPTQGYIDWKANNYVSTHGNKYLLEFKNFDDTTDWRYLIYWANLRESIFVDFDVNRIGKQKLVGTNVNTNDTNLLRSDYLRAWGGGDIFDAHWLLDSSYVNQIEITHIDWIKMVFEGNFDLYFKLDQQSTIPNVKYSDKAHFRCGKFKAKMRKG